MNNSAVNKLSISIINFNSGDYLTECLESLSKLKDELKFEVWVVDNKSSDESFTKAKKEFPNFNYVQNEENLGFGKANNQVLEKIKTEYVLFLNPDSKVLAGTLKHMVDFMDETKDAGAASCRVEKLDGSLDWASHRSFPTPWVSFSYFVLKNDNLYHQKYKNLNETHEVDTIVGAFFLTRKSLLDKIGYFDEDYFLYAEDIDLCFRIKKAGFKVYYVPKVKIIHLKGISSGIKSHSQNLSASDKESRLRAFNSFYETMAIFYKKNLAKNYPFFINWLVYLGINLKWMMAKRKMVV